MPDDTGTDAGGFPLDPAAELDRESWAQSALIDLGVEIRAARIAAGMTQEALAGALGCSPTAVSYWEAGKRDPGVPGLLRVAAALGVTAASLLPGQARTEDANGCAVPGGCFTEIAFFGHIEHAGYVTEVTLHGGRAAYRIDLPEKIWGGNPLAWREYAASALFGKHPVTEESVKAAWEAERERAARWERQQAEWQQSPAALTAGDDDYANGPF